MPMFASTRWRWRWRRSTVLLLAAAMAASLFTALFAAPAHALIQDRPAWTWNMQGATADGQSKWTTVVGPALNQNQPVVALQEVGSGPPPSAPGTTDMTLSGTQLAALPASMYYDVPDNPAARTVRHTQWAYGGVLHDVYYLQTDANNGTWASGRVNLAIVTPRAADDVVIIPTPGGRSSNGALRPALGVRIGTTWYFSIHAASGGGSNAPGLLANINSFVTARNASDPLGEEGLVLGDFNRDPSTLPAVTTQQIISTPVGTPTQRQGGRLDYGVIVEPDGLFPSNIVAGIPNATLESDHQPVRIQLSTTATPTFSAVPVYPTPRVIENAQAGGVLDAHDQGTADFTPIDSYARNGQSNQAWTVLGYPDGSERFVGVGSSRCVDITHSDQDPGSGTGLSLYDCSDQDSQRWLPIYLGNSQFELQSVLLPSLCMNVSGGQSDPTSANGLVLYGCANTPNERFFFGPANLSTQTDTNGNPFNRITSPTALENMYNGGAMDVQGNGTANNTEVDSYSRNGQSNQAWDIGSNPDGTVSFQSVSSGRCLDIHNSTTAALGRDLVVFDCAQQASQEFFPIALTDGQWEFESALPAVEGACLTTAGASSGDPRSGNETVDTCDGSATQFFTMTPYDPTGTPVLPTDPDVNKTYSLIAVPNAPVPAQRVAYYTSWSTYANAFYPKALDTEGIAGKLTVLDYAFENIDPVNLTCFAANQAASTDPNTTTGNDGSSDAYADYQKEYAAGDSVNGVADTWDQPLRGNFNQLKELKAKYPNLKVLLTIGGWTYSKFFSDVAATDASRKKFVSSCIDMYIKGNLPQLGDDPAGGPGAAAGIFDGFDIDWEFPGSPDGHPGNHYSAQDGANFTALLNEFRTELNALGSGYMLTAALPAGPTEIANLDIPGIASALDFGDVEGYDFHGAFETSGPTNFQSPLYDAPDSPAFGTKFTANDAISSYISGGFPSAKLTLGVPFYGRGWTGVPDGGQHGLYQTVTGPTAAFSYSQEAGVADYKELEAAGLLTSSNMFYDSDSQSTWVYDGTNFWSIETPTTLALKRQYIQQNNLGGIMMYSLEADDANTTLLDAATGLN